MGRIFGIAAAVVLAMAGRGDAQQAVYYNMDPTHFSGFGWYEDPQITLTSFNPTTNNTMTIFVADDIFITPNLPTSIGRVQFTMFSDNFQTVTARPRLLFYNNNRADGGPGTFIAEYILNPISINQNNVLLLDVDLGANPFNVDGSFWAGVAFDDMNGTLGISEQELKHLGQGIFSPTPPNLGSSSDEYFHSSALNNWQINNPQGQIDDFLGIIPANFGWAFYRFSGVPEPSTFVLVAAAGGLGCWRLRRSRSRTARE